MTLRIFLDTNILLHFRTLNEINWASIVEQTPVELVFPSIIVREIDKKKIDAPTRRIRDRARVIIGVLKQLRSELQFTVGREVIRVNFLPNEPQLDWQALQLDSSLNDDRLIASILMLCREEQLPLEDVCLISNDFGLQLKAQSRAIRVVELPDSLALDLANDATELELRKAKEELGKLRQQFPKLSLRFGGATSNSDHLRVQFPNPTARPTEKELSDTVKSVENNLLSKVPVADTRDFSKHLFGEAMKLVAVSPERIKEYKQAVTKYIQEYPKHLNKEYQFRDRLARTIRMDITFLNTGSAPAEDSDIFLHFPDGFILTDKEPPPYKIPEPPKPPRDMFEELQETMSLTSRIPRLHDYGLRNTVPTLPNVSAPKITRSRSYDVRVRVNRIKHTMEIQLDPMWVIFADYASAESFTVSYRILAANYPEAFQGDLHLIIEKG